MATLKSLGWNATSERTDPPTRETAAQRKISDGFNGLLIREDGNGAAVMYMEDPIEVVP